MVQTTLKENSRWQHQMVAARLSSFQWKPEPGGCQKYPEPHSERKSSAEKTVSNNNVP